MVIGIISYLPDEKELRDKRKKAIRKQVDFLREVLPEVEIFAVAQNYGDEDYIDGIRYSKHEHGIHSWNARNEILKEFYNSNEDFLLLCDDDAVMYPYYGAWDLLKEIRDNPKKFYGIGRISGNFPRQSPFKEKNLKDRERMEKYWKFVPMGLNAPQQICIYENIKKHNGKELYFDEPLYKDLCDDVDFNMKWVVNGLTEYVCEQWQIIDCSDSTICNEDRANETVRALLTLFKKYGAVGCYKNGRVNYTWFKNRDKSKRVGYIPRKEPKPFGETELKLKRRS